MATKRNHYMKCEDIYPNVPFKKERKPRRKSNKKLLQDALIHPNTAINVCYILLLRERELETKKRLKRIKEELNSIKIDLSLEEKGIEDKINGVKREKNWENNL